MKFNRILIMLLLASLFAACQMPSQSMPGSPSPPSSPSGAPPSSSPPSGPPPSSPGGTPPAGPSGSPPSSDGGGDPGSSAPPGGGDEPSPDGGYPVTEAEDGVEGLDEQLDEALEDFDDAVAGQGSDAQDQELDILNPTGGGSAGVQSDEPLFEEGDIGESGGDSAENDSVAQRAAEGAPGEAGAPVEGELASSGSSGKKQESDADIIPVPDDVGDGRSDDIVLRQIRAAATTEHDPVLREKLWDEYRRIKG